MSSPLIWNGLNAKALTNDILIDNANFEDLRMGNQFSYNSSTGIISGGILSINADPTKFNLSAGNGQIINYSVPNSPTLDKVTWTTFTAQTVTGLASQDETYILIDGASAITQLSNFPTPTERRGKIFIGRVGHSSRTSIQFATSFPDYSQSVGAQLFDLQDALGAFNISGNQVTANGSNLNFNKTAGKMFFRSFNYPTDTTTPSYVTSPATIPQTFFYRTQLALINVSRTAIDAANFDSGGTVAPVGGGANASTVQRVYLSPNGTVQIQYGQTTYPTLTAAVAAIGTENFIINPGIANTGILIAYIAVNKNCLALNDPVTCQILRAPRFETGVGGGVNTVTNLQQTYNSSIQPQIILDSTHLGLQFYDNSTPIAGSLFKVANNAGTTDYLNVSATSVATKLPIAMSGSTSGTVTTQVQAAAGTFNFNLPTSAGTSGQFLTSGGGAAAPMTWASGMTNPMTTLGDIIFEDGTPAPARLPGNTTTTAKFLSQTGTGSVSAAPTWSTFAAPIVQKFTTTGAGTYTLSTPRPLYIRVRATGGGGGGNSNSTAGDGSGGGGNPTTFGSIITLNGGSGGASTAGGAGGTFTAPGLVGIFQNGARGGPGAQASAAVTALGGGYGGATLFGGAGATTDRNAAGGAAVALSGAGGAGAGSFNGGTGAVFSGGGGGGGASCDVIISGATLAALGASVSLSIGTAGLGSTTSTGKTFNGGDGSQGFIEVTEYFQ